MRTAKQRTRRILIACSMVLTLIVVTVMTREAVPVVLLSLPGRSAAGFSIDAGRLDILLREAAAGFSDGRRLMLTLGRPYRPSRPIWMTPSPPARGILTGWREGVDPDDRLGIEVLGAAAGFGAVAGRRDASVIWLSLPPWVPTAGLALFAAWNVAALLHSRGRPRDACPNCGYLLRNVDPLTERCPECGRPIDPPRRHRPAGTGPAARAVETGSD